MACLAITTAVTEAQAGVEPCTPGRCRGGDLPTVRRGVCCARVPFVVTRASPGLTRPAGLRTRTGRETCTRAISVPMMA
jgi:hypothetical protein